MPIGIIEKHKIAARKLELIKDLAFEFIKNNLGKVSEFDVNQFILSEFERQNLWTDYPSLIVAADKNTSFIHYFPKRKKTVKIGKNCLILLDIWGRLKEADAPFADITWMAFSGKDIPKEIRKTFNEVTGARNNTLNFIRKNLKNRKFPETKDIDEEARNYFKKLGIEKYFLHGLGHSLGLKECHGKYFRFGKKTNTKLKPDIPFTVEPGLYFKNKFGVRSEINCYVTRDFKLVITTKVQKKIVKI